MSFPASSVPQSPWMTLAKASCHRWQWWGIRLHERDHTHDCVDTSLTKRPFGSFVRFPPTIRLGFPALAHHQCCKSLTNHCSCVHEASSRYPLHHSCPAAKNHRSRFSKHCRHLNPNPQPPSKHSTLPVCLDAQRTGHPMRGQHPQLLISQGACDPPLQCCQNQGRFRPQHLASRHPTFQHRAWQGPSSAGAGSIGSERAEIESLKRTRRAAATCFRVLLAMDR